MKTIWKFNLSKSNKHQLLMPQGANILCTNIQNGDICLWAEVDAELDASEWRYFYIFGTGWELPEYLDDYKYIGTVFESAFVWHIYEGI